MSYTPKLKLSTYKRLITASGAYSDEENLDNLTIERTLANSFAGNPNGFVQGYFVGMQCFDSTNNEIYVCTTIGDAVSTIWEKKTGNDAGVTDHGALTGLGDDDHTQYLTQARGDARYYTQSEVDALIAALDDTPTRITITGSYTLTPPSLPVDFQRAKYWIVASGADRALTLHASIIIPTSSTFTSPVTIANGKKAKVLIEYDASKAQWELTSFLNGY